MGAQVTLNQGASGFALAPGRANLDRNNSPLGADAFGKSRVG
jgi:hypothetical protein